MLFPDILGYREQNVNQIETSVIWNFLGPLMREDQIIKNTVGSRDVLEAVTSRCIQSLRTVTPVSSLVNWT